MQFLSLSELSKKVFVITEVTETRELVFVSNTKGRIFSVALSENDPEIPELKKQGVVSTRRSLVGLTIDEPDRDKRPYTFTPFMCSITERTYQRIFKTVESQAGAFTGTTNICYDGETYSMISLSNEVSIMHTNPEFKLMAMTFRDAIKPEKIAHLKPEDLVIVGRFRKLPKVVADVERLPFTVPSFIEYMHQRSNFYLRHPCNMRKGQFTDRQMALAKRVHDFMQARIKLYSAERTE